MNDLSLLRHFDRRSLKRLVFSAAAVIWCGFIFYMSSQDGTESSLTSGGFISFLCRIFMPGFAGFDDASRAAVISDLQFIVRKCAHFTAYLILAFFMVQVFLALPRPKKLFYRCLFAWIFCVLYAVSDEIHQSFVPGRAMQLRDMAIDSCGALLGVFVSLGISYISMKLHKRRQRKQDKA